MLTQSPRTSGSERPRMAPNFFRTATIAMGILSLGNPKAQSEPLDDSFFTPERLAEIFPHVSLGDISGATKSELRDLIINDTDGTIEDIREYALAEIKSIGQSIQENIHNRIMTDTDFRSLYDIREHALAELRKEGIFPTGMEVQIVPFDKSENGKYKYLEIVVTTSEGTEVINLLSHEPEKAGNVLTEIITNFESHIGEASLMVLKQSMENEEFNRIEIQKTIDTVLKTEFQMFFDKCYKYIGCHIARNPVDGVATIYITFSEKAGGNTLSLLYNTGIVIPPLRPTPKNIYEPSITWAQNTSGTHESIHSLGQ